MARPRKSAIPDDLQSVLRNEHINIFFKYLEKEFHLSKQWKLDFHSELLRQSNTTSSTEFFCIYSQKYLEPVLKQLLRRKDNVTFALLRYLLKDKPKQEKEIRLYVNRK